MRARRSTIHTARIEAVLADNLVWDNHACMPLRPGDHSFLPQLRRYRDAGVNVVTLNIGFGRLDLAQHLQQVEDFRAWLSGRPDEYVLALSVADIDRAHSSGKLAVLFDIEGMRVLEEGELDLIARFRRLGVGWMLVAYNETNALGGGCRDNDTGLTLRGREVLREMRRVGMIVCCSHTGHRTAREVIEEADNPVIFSHSNPSAVHAHYRNIPDELIRAVADVGGVIGINGVGEFLGPGRNYASMMARHIDHAVSLVGPSHVGVALDYVFDRQELMDYIENMPETFGKTPNMGQLIRFAPPEVFKELVRELLALGYACTDIGLILGGNWRRVAEAVWQPAQ